MKIKPSVNRNVVAAVRNCREVLVEETLNLLKSIGAGVGDTVLFREALFLHEHKGYISETVVCDRITPGDGYYIVSMDESVYVPMRSDTFLTIDSLQRIYNEVRKVVRNH